MDALLTVLLAAFLLLLLAVWTGFASSMLLTSRYELKRRAQSGDERAKIIYGLTANGRLVYIALLLGGVLIISLFTLLTDSIMPSLLAALLSTVVLGIFGVIVPFVYGEKLGLAITVKVAPLAARLLTISKPLLQPLANAVDTVIGKKPLLYSKEQLLRIIDTHAASPLTDITKEEALLVRSSLMFGQKTIKDIMIPRKVVSMVSSAEQLGPLLMDELHKSGHSRFPVYDSTNPDILVGTLYLRDLIRNKKSGFVKDAMHTKVYFVHEELDLNHALDAFIKTKHHLFVVVNNFEEYVGILTIEDVLEQVIGRQIIDEFDNYDNMREVAALRAKRAHADNKNHAA